MRKVFVAVGLFLIGFASSVQAQFCPGVSPWVFDDVAASDPFCPNITWMALNNITLGCAIVDPTDRLYCPNDSVTRKQMAAFMNRLGSIRVQEINTGPGLTGGPITLTGTIGLTATQLLPNTACASGQVPKWNGTNWTCATIAAGTGTVTSVAAGTGLAASPSPITTTGSLNVAPSYRLPQGCSNGQVAKSNGSGGWTCAADNAGPANAFVQGGNAFGATAVLGTTDSQVLELQTSGEVALRLVPNVNGPNVVGGDASNSVGAHYGQTIAGGVANAAASNFATVAGGTGNTASGVTATVAGGELNTANGTGAFVAGGYSNVASGRDSFAAGFYADADQDGCFLFADVSSAIPTKCNSPNVFVARAINGFYFYTAGDETHGYTGAFLGAGSSSWATLSDRNSKANVEAVDPHEVLINLIAIPMATWNWKSQDARIRHMGPMAQDFYAAFGLGEDDKHITTVDEEGVALAAIQGLYAELKERDATIAELRERVTQLESLRGEVAALRNAIAAVTRGATIAAQARATAP